MILHVANLGNPILRRVADPVEPARIKEPLFQAFLDDLLQSMEFHDGVGLAAPQVFHSIRVIAVQVPDDMDDDSDEDAGVSMQPAVYINPELSDKSDEMLDGWEGCLSLKDLRGIVPRHASVHLAALDRDGKPIDISLKGFAARVFQHEMDHLDGIVFTDRMENMNSLVFLNELEKYGPPGMED